MLRPGVVVLAGVFALASVGCGNPNPEPETTVDADTPAAAPVVFEAPASTAGRLSIDGDRLLFQPCGMEAGPTTVDDTPDGRTADLVKSFGGGPITAMVVIEGGRLVQIRYAGAEGPDCSRLPPAADVEARGNEPFWTVRVTGTAATVTTPEMMDGVAYAGGAWVRPSDNQWRFDATREGGGTLSLVLTAAECTDSMSGARFPFRATLTRDGAAAEGCALEGRASAASNDG